METGASLLYSLGLLVLVGSALATYRLPFGQMAKMALAWLIIFGAIFFAIKLWTDMSVSADQNDSVINESLAVNGIYNLT